MSHTPHELAEEFPADVERIHALKLSDTHFAGLCEAYHAINRAVHRAETDLEPTDDFHMTQMRRERLRLKDQIHAILSRRT